MDAATQEVNMDKAMADKLEADKLEQIAKLRHEIEILTYYIEGPLNDKERENISDVLTQAKANLVYTLQGHTEESNKVVSDGKTKEMALQSKIGRATKKVDDAKAEYESLMQQAAKFQEKRAKKVAEALAKEYIG